MGLSHQDKRLRIGLESPPGGSPYPGFGIRCIIQLHVREHLGRLCVSNETFFSLRCKRAESEKSREPGKKKGFKGEWRNWCLKEFRGGKSVIMLLRGVVQIKPRTEESGHGVLFLFFFCGFLPCQPVTHYV